MGYRKSIYETYKKTKSKHSDPIKAFIKCVVECAKTEKDTADYIKAQEWSYE